ncbi:nitrogen regulatory protein OTam [Paraphoma chrysanthemicola]|uniref:Nitrogen regulatory protein OTam n=1 Tax=Paraphoma chrysanthemicola TaxID=798071 RepID=A0A8K0R755_9PLEO|nr:nitrogen regulatory protein OTam [Paraphoma chrysanthemicola]
MNLSPTQSITPNDFFPVTSDQSIGTKVRSRRPCDPCRRRKSRCEIADGSPPCLLCRFHRQNCTFNEEPQPRKRRATAPNEDDQPTIRTDVRNPPDMRYASPQSHESSKIRQDVPIDDYANLRGPSLLKKTLGLQQNRHSRFVGSTSVYEPTLLDLRNDEEADIAVGASVLRRVDTHDTAFILSPDSDTQNHQDDIQDLDAIETIVAPHGQALIHLYFRIVHPSFPVLHKKVYLEKYERTHREFSPPLLAAVYLLALNWWSYSSELALLPKPDVSRLEKLALKTMGNIVHRPKLSTIQAGLLLLQRPEGDSWALTSQLVGLGQDLGLHLDCTQWRVPSWERGLRKRLAWALFMQDKWGSLVHGRPSHVTLSDWEVQPLGEDDFPENAADEDDEDGSTEVEKGRTLFCEMIKLTELLANILSRFYTLRAEREAARRANEGVRWILEIAKPLQLALRQWFSSLPAVLKMENLAARKLSSTGYLHLGYYAVEMTLHRRILRYLSSVDDRGLRSICRQAAQVRLKSAMDFVSSLRPEHLQSFWYSASKYNFALVGTFISLLWATATTSEEADLYKKSLDEYRWVLRLSSKSADFLERAIGVMAASTGVLVKAIPENPDADRILGRALKQAESEATTTSGYIRHNSHVPSLAYRSESEMHEETSPENAVGETPSDSGAGGPSWNVEHTWFGTVGDVSAAFVGHDEGGMSDAYLGLDDAPIEFDYSQNS